MIALNPAALKFGPLAERIDALSLRERALIFGAGVALLFLAWHILLMQPLNGRAKLAELRLTESRQTFKTIDQVGALANADPLIAAAARNRALKSERQSLDAQLHTLAQGYVAPERMTELLRELLDRQRGLTLISLSNLPVMSLSQAPGAKSDGPIDKADRGPFLHPVQMVFEGDYASTTAYLRALEALPWRIHWQQLELTAGDYPSSRVSLTVGALSLSREWINI